MTDKNPTTNHDLPRPATGTFEGTWGEDVMNNDMTDKLEKKLVARDTESNKGNYTPYSNAIFIATDTGAVFDGDGTSWNKAERDFQNISASSLSTEQNFNADNPVTARVYHDGAEIVANGRNGEIDRGTDMGAVLNSAISAVSDTNSPGTGQTIAIQKGRYTVSTTIQLGDGVILQGEGMRTTVLEAADGLNANMIEYIPDSSTDREFFAGPNDLKLLGNKENNTSGHGIYCHEDSGTDQDANDFHMNRVFIHKFPEEGFYGENVWGYHISHSLFETCDGSGIHLSGGSQCYLTDIFTAYNGNRGLYLETSDCEVKGVRSRSNVYGVSVTSPDNTLVSCTSHMNDGWGIKVNANDCEVTSCTAKNNGQNATGDGVILSGDRITLTGGQYFDDQDSTPRYGVQVDGSDCVVNGARAPGNNPDLYITSNSANTYLDVRYGTITNNGTNTNEASYTPI